MPRAPEVRVPVRRVPVPGAAVRPRRGAGLGGRWCRLGRGLLRCREGRRGSSGVNRRRGRSLLRYGGRLFWHGGRLFRRGGGVNIDGGA